MTDATLARGLRAFRAAWLVRLGCVFWSTWAFWLAPPGARLSSYVYNSLLGVGILSLVPGAVVLARGPIARTRAARWLAIAGALAGVACGLPAFLLGAAEIAGHPGSRVLHAASRTTPYAWTGELLVFLALVVAVRGRAGRWPLVAIVAAAAARVATLFAVRASTGDDRIASVAEDAAVVVAYLLAAHVASRVADRLDPPPEDPARARRALRLWIAVSAVAASVEASSLARAPIVDASRATLVLFLRLVAMAVGAAMLARALPAARVVARATAWTSAGGAALLWAVRELRLGGLPSDVTAVVFEVAAWSAVPVLASCVLAAFVRSEARRGAAVLALACRGLAGLAALFGCALVAAPFVYDAYERFFVLSVTFAYADVTLTALLGAVGWLVLRSIAEPDAPPPEVSVAGVDDDP